MAKQTEKQIRAELKTLTKEHNSVLSEIAKLSKQFDKETEARAKAHDKEIVKLNKAANALQTKVIKLSAKLPQPENVVA
jgi:ElaB/YqjD/DUF883 family membrane-anchored ribosome-binding protein